MSPGCQDRRGGDRDDRDAHLAVVLRPLLSQVSTGHSEINQLSRLPTEKSSSSFRSDPVVQLRDLRISDYLRQW